METLAKIILLIVLLVIIWFIYHNHYKSEYWPAKNPVLQSTNKYKKNRKLTSWTDKLIREELSEDDLKRHYNDMVRNTPIFSSGAGYSEVAEDNTSPAMTHYVGLFPPSYVPIMPGQRQVTDLDTSQFLKNKRIKW